MRIHRFYIETELSSGDTLHSEALFNQTKRVLRLQVGEKLSLFNGNGQDHVSTIVSYGKNAVEIEVGEGKESSVSPDKEVWLFFSLVKRDNVDWILQKGTELGVSCFVPVVSARSEKKDINIERAQKIVIEAVEQSGRNKIPKIEEITKLEDVFDKFHMPLVVLERGEETLSKDLLSDNSPTGILIGPEGGWTQDEIELFKNRKAIFRSLGSATLRAETAVVASISLLNI